MIPSWENATRAGNNADQTNQKSFLSSVWMVAGAWYAEHASPVGTEQNHSSQALYFPYARAKGAPSDAPPQETLLLCCAHSHHDTANLLSPLKCWSPLSPTICTISDLQHPELAMFRSEDYPIYPCTWALCSGMGITYKIDCTWMCGGSDVCSIQCKHVKSLLNTGVNLCESSQQSMFIPVIAAHWPRDLVQIEIRTP
jgi:hypothetical protein